MSRCKRGHAPQDTSFDDPELQAYRKALSDLGKFLFPSDMERMIYGWNKRGLDVSQKLIRAQVVLAYAETHPDLVGGQL